MNPMILDELVIGRRNTICVIPAKAGIQKLPPVRKSLDPVFTGVTFFRVHHPWVQSCRDGTCLLES